MKKILIFRTDRLGDFILTKKSLNNLIYNNEEFEIDVVASLKNFKYIKNFKTIKNIYIFKNSYIKFFFEYFFIFKKRYDYLILYDGKKRSHIISFFLKGKKISFSKSKGLFKIANFFNYISIFNTDYTSQFENFNFVNLLLGKKNNNLYKFYSDYKFHDLKFKLPLKIKDNFIIHLDEKWFRGYYYHDFDYFEWNNEFFVKLINTVIKKFNSPVIITTGNQEIPFIKNLKKNLFSCIKENVYEMNKAKGHAFLIDKLSFEELESLIKIYSKVVLCCEGGLSHVTDNLEIKTFALIQQGRENFYKHWTGHMNNISLINRGNKDSLLNFLENSNTNKI